MRHSIDSGLAVKGFLIPDPEIQGRLFLSLLISGGELGDRSERVSGLGSKTWVLTL